MLTFPIKTVVKFYENPKKGPNPVISRSLLKVSVVDSEWLAAHTQAEWAKDGELWLVDIVKETKPKQAGGCFILHPIKRVEIGDLGKLVPGLYQETEEDGILRLVPNQRGLWMLPLKFKQILKKRAYAIIVDLN